MYRISIFGALVFWHCINSDWNAAAQPVTRRINCPAVPEPVSLHTFEQSISEDTFWIAHYRTNESCGFVPYPIAFPLLSKVQYSIQARHSSKKTLALENYVPVFNYHGSPTQEQLENPNYMNNVDIDSMWYRKYTFDVDSKYAIFESHPNYIYRNLKKSELSSFQRSPTRLLDELNEVTSFALYYAGNGYNVYVACDNTYAWVEIAQSRMNERFQQQMSREIRNIINNSMPGQVSRKTRDTVGNYEYLKRFFE